jgi:mRNA degradation ribonuclease J1/J2
MSTGCSRSSTPGIAAGRKIAFFGRSMHRNTGVAVELGMLDVPNKSVVDIKKLKDCRRSGSC